MMKIFKMSPIALLITGVWLLAFGMTTGIAQAAVQVAVDIKPTSCPNPLNVKSKGTLSVAVLGTADFDVTQVDPAGVTLNGVAPLRWSIEDVATPFDPFNAVGDCFDCIEDGPDGFSDLVLKFNMQEVIVALGPVEDRDCIDLILTGALWDGTSFTGQDMVIILKRGEN